MHWQEAQRMAPFNRRETYLAPSLVPARANLEALFSGKVDLLFRDGPVEVAAPCTHPGGGAR